MAEAASRRPGRPLSTALEDLSHQPQEVAQLVLALRELIIEAGTSLAAIAEATPGFTNRQALSRSLRHPNGPDEHVVEGVVRYCSRALGEPEEPQLSRFLAMWNDARATVLSAVDPDAGQPTQAVDPVDPGLVAPVLLLISEGHCPAAAGLLAATYPQGGQVLGQILIEVGRRTPGGVADLLDAVTEQVGSETARAYRDALHMADPTVAAAVQAVPRTAPDLIEPPASAGPETAGTPDVMHRTPQEIEGQRRARQVRTGDVAQVVAEIIAEATTQSEAGPEAESAGSASLFSKLIAPDPQSALDTERAWQLIVDICKQDPDDDIILASILTQTIAAGHPGLALKVLRAVYELSTDEGPGYVQEILKQMKRPELLSALDHLASGKADVASDTLPLLLAQAPPRVTALFFLKQDPSALPPSLDICDLPRLDTILRSMIEVNSPATALVLARQIMRWDHAFSLKDDGPEKKFASAFLHLARADPDGTGRLLHALFGQSPAEASKLMCILETPDTESAVVDATARALGRALQNDSLTAGFIARSSRDHTTAYRLLDRVAQNDASHATLLITAMLSTDLNHFRSLLPTMIRESAPILAVQMLRQLSDRNPGGPWQDIAQALEDDDPDAALARLDSCLLFPWSP